MSVRRYALKRLLSLVPILFGVSVVTFAVVHLTPGDPIDRMVTLNPHVTAGDEAQLRARYGLDEPIWEQYLRWLERVLTGDFGRVYGSGRDVSDVVVERLPETVALALTGLTFGLAIAVPTGIYAAVHKGGRADTASRVLALTGVAIPNFWLGLLLVLVGSLTLDLWPVLPPTRKPLYHPETLWYLVLPGITIGTAAASSITRVLRTSMAEELNREYVTAARAKGLPERTVVLKHALRNSLTSVVTLTATLLAGLLAGSVVVEVVFNWPGLGRALVDAVAEREIDLITAITLLTGVTIVVANLLADVLYAVLDPRISYD